MSFFEAPLSETQHEMWIAESLDPGTTAFHVPLALDLQGSLDIAALEQALAALWHRHEVLRTTFSLTADGPQQRIHEEFSLPLRRIALADSSAADGSPAQLHALLQELATQPFALDSHAWHLALITCTEGRHILFLCLHHLICDGWSLSILAHDLQQFYRAAIAAKTANTSTASSLQDALPELEYQFVDWSEWQRETPPAPDALEHRAAQFASLPPPFALEAVAPQLHMHASSLRAELNLAQWGQIQRSARAAGVTPFEWLCSLFGLFVGRLMQVDDVVLATPFANREREEFARTAGYFVSTLLLRQSVQQGRSFADHLAATAPALRHTLALGAVPPLAWQERCKSMHPGHSANLARVMFALQNATSMQSEWGADLKATPLALENGGAKYDLMLRVEPYASHTSIIFEYRQSMFAPALAASLLNAWLAWIEYFSVDSQRRPADLALSGQLAPSQAAFKPSALASFGGDNLWQAFVAQAAQNGQQIAASDGNGNTLSYAELQLQAQALGNRLLALGVKPEQRIGLAVERNNDMLLGIFGILAAGACYVPLDPRYPAERLHYLVQDAGLELVLADADGMAALAPLQLPQQRLRLLPELLQAATATADSTASVLVHPAQAAYVIYTSGSSGQPKGCVISHQNVLSLVSSATGLHGYHADDVWTVFHSYSFDFSVWEIYAALLTGGRILIVPYLTSRDPEGFYQLLAQEKVSVLSQTPTAFRSLLAVDAALHAAGNAPSLALRRVIFGGEALEPAMLAGWYERHGEDTEMINMYGITETTVHVSNRVLDSNDLQAGSVIGEALPGWQMYLLDAALQPVLPGLSGELFIGGAGIARGYLGRAALSAERFMPDPFGPPGSRMYRSGDLARRRLDGELEYLGRADQQVKIRGFRIELGEIEAALCAHEAVQNAIVLAMDDRNDGQPRLLAWLIPSAASENAAEIAPATILDSLHSRLPQHMVPAVAMWIQHVPLTTNGKLDRAALPLPAASQTNAHEQAQNASEELLIKLWQECLGLAAVGRNDNFFTLGGDSILALRLVAKAREHGLVCSPRDVFQQPTPASLAAFLALNSAQHEVEDVEQEQADAALASALTPLEAWFFDLNLPARQHWQQAVALEFASSVDKSRIELALQQVLARHSIFFTEWHLASAGWQVQQAAGMPRHLCLELANDGADADGTEQQARAAALAQQYFNLADGPISVCVFLPGSPQRALWLIHHLAVDTVSWHILLEQLNAALAGTETANTSTGTGTGSGSNTLRSSRGRRIRTAAQRDIGRLARWQQAAVPDLFFPHNRASTAPCTYAAQVQRSICLDDAQRSALLAACGSGLRLDELLLAALASSLASICGQSQIPLTLEQHGRDMDTHHASATQEVGWFTVLAPFAVSAPASASLLDCLAQTIAALAAWTPCAHEWLELRQRFPAEAGRLPQVSFNYLGNFAEAAHVASDANLRILPMPDLALHDPTGERPFAHDLLAWSDRDGLHLAWRYDSLQHSAAEIDTWLQLWQSRLLELPVALANQGLRLPPLALQEGMMFHAANDQAQRLPSYLTQVRGMLDGDFCPKRFAAAWQAVVQHHAALRTRFCWLEDGRVLQQIDAQVPLVLREIDLTGLNAEYAEQVFAQALQADHSKPLVLEKAPLMRFLLARLDGNRWAFGWTHHHAIVDGWSLPVILENLLAFYDAGTELNTEAQASLPTRPQCTALELVRHRLGLDALTSKAAWSELLAPLQEPCRLSISNPQPSQATAHDLERLLTPAQGQALSALAQTHGLTLNCLFQTAWTLTVAAFSATTRPCFGVTISGRDAPLAGIERLVGLAINTLPMALQLQPQESVIALAQRLQATLVQMQAHGEVVLPTLQRLSGHAGQELFDTLYVFENYPRGAIAGRCLTVSEIVMSEQAHYSATLAVVPGSEISLRLALRGGYLDAADGMAILDYLQACLASMLHKPHAVLASFQALPAPQPAVAKRVAEDGSSLAAIFEQTAARYPQAVALAWDDMRLSYAELDARAECIASALQAQGIGAEMVVAVCAPREADTIAALLGISKAGAAFLPLDHDLPPARLAKTLAQARPALLLAGGKVSAALAECAEAVAIQNLTRSSVPELIATTRLPSGPRPRPVCHPASLAYVIYTSGSTGAPKGIAVSQRGIFNLMQSQQTLSHLSATSRVYQFASLGFDAAVSEVLMAFGAGGVLCLPSAGKNILEIDLEADLARLQPSHITLPPSLLGSLAPSALASVRCILVAGERSGAAQLAPWLNDQRRIVNAYGPSEATVCASMEAWDGIGDPLLGTAMHGVSMWLLDEWLRPVPPGVTGELYLGGIGLARGYCEQARMTANAFIPHPFSTVAGERLYRSGDLARQLADGRLQYMGRSDQQIKIRGQRVEPGEVEAFLCSLPQVRQASVAALKQSQEGGDGMANNGVTNKDVTKLAAWLELEASETPVMATLATIASLSSAQLTAAMVPSLWAVVESWPRSIAGKLDHKQLPPALPLALLSANVDGLEHAAELGKPLFSQLLQEICSVWASTLGLAEVSAQDDFYAIGGDSISAMRIASRLRAAGHALQPRDILTHTSPSLLARHLAAANTNLAAQHLPEMLSAAPLAPAQHWFLNLAEQTPQRFLLSLQLRLQANVDLPRLALAVQAALHGHSVLHSRLSSDLQQQLANSTGPLPLLLGAAHQAQTEFLSAARAMVEPLQGPAFVCAIHPGDADGVIDTAGANPGAVLLLVGHHLWIDVISLQRMVEEIEAAYHAGSNFQAYQPAATFLQWSSRLAAFTRSSGFDMEAAFWRTVLAPSSRLRQLPALRPRYAEVGHQEWRVSLGGNHGLPSVEALVLQALANVLSSAEQDELLVECERHGRDAVAQMDGIDVSDALGWFTAAFPLRLQRNQDVTAISNLSKRMANIVHGGVGFSALRAYRREQLGPDFAELYSNCRVGFNFLGRLNAGHTESQVFAAIASSAASEDIAPQLHLPHPFTVDAWLNGEELSVRWAGFKSMPQSSAEFALDKLAAAHQQEVLRLLQQMNGTKNNQADSNDLPADEMQALLNELDWL